MPTLQNTLWCHKFPPPLGTSWGLSSRKLLCYSIILDYGNIVGDRSWAFPIRCITATTAAAAELQRAWWHGPWLPQSSLSASDVIVAKTVRCLHQLLSFSPLVQHGYAEHSPFSACLAFNLEKVSDGTVHILRRACAIKQSERQTHDNKVQKSYIQYLSKVTAGAEDSQFNCGVLLDPSQWRDDSGLRREWSALPPEVALFSGATPSGRSSSSSDCVRDRDRSLALLSDKCTSELAVLTLSHIPEWKHSAEYHSAYFNSSKGLNKL